MIFLLLSICFFSGLHGFHKVPEKFPCASKLYSSAGDPEQRLVCVCNSTYCDKIEPAGEKIEGGKVLVYQSSLAGDRLTKYVTEFEGTNGTVEATITINANVTKQEVFGFGGAFTDMVGRNIIDANKELKAKFFEVYFGPDGLDYNLGRVPIGSTDFSHYAYSYSEEKDDYELKHFNLSRDDHEYKIQFIVKALELQPNLKLIASSWSAPAWMKDTGKIEFNGKLLNDTRVYKAYADYLAKFFEEYARNNVTFWGMTVQNAPRLNSIYYIKWQTMAMSAEMERDFLKNYLGPRLKRGNVTKNLKVMVLDDVRDTLVNDSNTIFNDPVATTFADGVALHWYRDDKTPIKVFDETHQNHPTKFLLSTEACFGYLDKSGVKIGNWTRAEEIAFSQIEYLNHWVSGWVDWNLLLNELGGPNWANHLVDAPVIVNGKYTEFYKQPMFYAMGHFSKFIRPGSRVIENHSNDNKTLNIACVKTPTDRRVCVISNREKREINIKITDSETGQSFMLKVAARSIQTVLWEKK